MLVVVIGVNMSSPSFLSKKNDFEYDIVIFKTCITQWNLGKNGLIRKTKKIETRHCKFFFVIFGFPNF
jgi:hypothetical protein